MDEENREAYEHALEGEDALVEEYHEVVAWLQAGMPDVVVPDHVMVMLRSAFGEALRPGPGGYVDDAICPAQDRGFSLADIRVPARLMFAREDTSVPLAHVPWAGEPHRKLGGGPAAWFRKSTDACCSS